MTADRQRIGRLNKARGKRDELEWAHTFGGQRNPDTGKTEADVFLGPFDLEVKGVRGMVGLLALVDEAVAKCRPGQAPVLGLTVRNGRKIRHLVVMERETVRSFGILARRGWWEHPMIKAAADAGGRAIQDDVRRLAKAAHTLAALPAAMEERDV